MNKAKRILSFALCLVMVLTLLPVAAFAAAPTAGDWAYDHGQKATPAGAAGYDKIYATNNQSSMTMSAYTALAYGRVESDMVIPGTDSTYQPGGTGSAGVGGLTAQGIAYWPAKNWFIVSAYWSGYRDKPGADLNGDYGAWLFAIDANTGRLVAKFQVMDPDGKFLQAKCGGIAISGNNLYLTAEHSYVPATKTPLVANRIAYIPLSSLDVGVNTEKRVNVGGLAYINSYFGANAPKASVDYMCFGEGKLWIGNFYDKTDENCPAVSGKYNTVISGYDLSGATSAAEWNALVAKLNTPDVAIGIKAGALIDNDRQTDDVQGIYVEGDSLVLNRSYGRANTSYITVANIPKTQATDLNIGTENYSIDAGDIAFSDSTMPLLEQGCIYNGRYYCVYESGAYQYRRDDSNGKAFVDPTDRIWSYDINNIIPPESDEETYTLTVNYLFGEDSKEHYGEVAAASWQGSFKKDTRVVRQLTLPTVQGYEFDKASIGATYDAATGKLNIDTTLNKNITLNVYYKPGMSDYRINLYRQNANDDNYTLYDTVIKQGPTESVVDDSAIGVIEGCTAPAYVKGVTIAADGSTVVDAYYDRDYYFVTFDLNGGMSGPNAIYGRYGSPMGDVTTPVRAGYNFAGWKDAEGHDLAYYNNTIPAKDVKFTAQWTPKSNTANVTVVLWGENANDEEYSYLGSKTVTATVGSNYTASANDIKSIPIAGVDSSKVFAQLAHVHDASCYNCPHTSHDITCQKGVTKNAPTGDPLNRIKKLSQGFNGSTPKEGYVFRYNGFGGGSDGDWTYYNGQWYKLPDDVYRGSQLQKESSGISWASYLYTLDTSKFAKNCSHTHTDACYSCGKTQADIPSDCLYYLVKNENITVNADGSSVVNVYLDRKTFTYKFNNENSVGTHYGYITAKWDENIYDQYKVINRNATGSDSKSAEWYYVNNKPNSSFTVTFTYMGKTDYNYHYDSANTTKRIHYQTQNLDLNGYTEVFSFYMGGGGYTDEERVPIAGFTLASGPKNGDTIRDGDTFKYTRNSYNLVLNNGKENVKTYSVLYEKTLSDVSGLSSYVPARPDTVPDNYSFGGWYLNPQCTGKQVNLSATKMPASNLVLYAKWIAPVYDVKFMNNDTLYQEKKVSCEDVVGAVAIPGDNFAGWYYMDNGIERRFDPATMSAPWDNFVVYAKYKSVNIVNYTISYKLQGTDTKVANDTVGQALSGSSKTFTAKGGNQLHGAYQEGYFPVTKSHNITFSGDTSYTFEYVARDKVPYTVRYLEAGTNKVLATAKVVSDNRMAVVTETYKNINKYVPDSVQKTLVIDIDHPDDNVITFYYTKDEEHAMVSVNVYLQQGSGYVKLDAYTLEEKAEVGAQYKYDVDEIYTAGEYFTFDHSNINGSDDKTDKVYSGTVTTDGVLINYYFNEKQSTINYVPVGNGTVSLESETTGYISGDIQGSTPYPGYRMKIEGWYTDPGCTAPVSASWIGDGYKLIPARQHQASVTYYAKFVPDSLYNRNIIVDYGLPTVFTLDGYAEIESVGTTAPNGIALETGTTKIDMLGDGKNAVKNATTDYAKAEISGNSLKYTLNKIINGIDTVYISAKTNLGTYRYASLSFVPATTVYYEDSIGSINYTNGKVNGSEATSGSGAWRTVGSDMSKDAIQSIANELYGNDKAYDDCTTYSMGSAHKVTVSAINNPNTKFSQTEKPGAWPTASFSFRGTGFDVISLTDTDTGLIKVKVEGKDANGNSVTKNLVVNEYYGYTCSKDAEHPYLVYIWEYVDEGWGWHIMHHENASAELNNAIPATKDELDAYIAEYGSTRQQNPQKGDTFVAYESNYNWTVDANADTLYQIPTMKVDNLPYGDYTVTITPTYGSNYDMNKDGSYSFSLDAIRVYGTLIDNEIYAEANEAAPEIYNVRTALLNQSAYQSGKDLAGIAFIDGITDNGTIDDYDSYGPNNEAYLKPGQAIAFAIDKNANIASVQVGFKAIKGEATVNVNGKEFTTRSATDMYRDITSCIGTDGVVTITNSGENLVSITTLKITHDVSNANVAPRVNDSVVQQAKAMVRSVMLASAPVEKAPFEPSVSINVADSATVGDEITVKVSTSEDVAFITVNGEKVEVHNADYVWTYTTTAEAEGEMGIEVVAYNYDGEAADAVQTASITVEAAPVVPDEPEEPEQHVSVIAKIINAVKSFFGKLFGR